MSKKRKSDGLSFDTNTTAAKIGRTTLSSNATVTRALALPDESGTLVTSASGLTPTTGVTLTTTQTISGQKTFSNTVSLTKGDGGISGAAAPFSIVPTNNNTPSAGTLYFTYFGRPTGVVGSTIPLAATVWIEGSPTSLGGITAAYALYVAQSSSYFGGTVISASTTDTSGAGTGAVQLAGGLYIAKRLFIGDTTNTTGTNTGSVQLAGGLYAAGRLFTAGEIYTGTYGSGMFGSAASTVLQHNAIPMFSVVNTDLSYNAGGYVRFVGALRVGTTGDTSSLPAISFEGLSSVGTGFYIPSANNIGVTCNATRTLNIGQSAFTVYGREFLAQTTTSTSAAKVQGWLSKAFSTSTSTMFTVTVNASNFGSCIVDVACTLTSTNIQGWSITFQLHIINDNGTARIYLPGATTELTSGASVNPTQTGRATVGTPFTITGASSGTVSTITWNMAASGTAGTGYIAYTLTSMNNGTTFTIA